MVNRILLAFIAVLPILIYVTDHLVPSCFAFKPANLQQLAKANIDQFGDDIPGLMKHLVKDLQAEYGNIVGDYDDSKWVFNVAGGSTGAMMILHASITEYLILFGSAAGTEGHSGMHHAHDYFTILSGRQTAGFLGEMRPRVFFPGDQHHHPRWNSAHYTLDNSTWALELAQGIIPTMFPFGLIQMPLACDFDGLFRTIWYTGKDTVMNLLKGKI